MLNGCEDDVTLLTLSAVACMMGLVGGACCAGEGSRRADGSSCGYDPCPSRLLVMVRQAPRRGDVVI